MFMRWIIKIDTRSSAQSDVQCVPKSPDQPNWPGATDGLTRAVITDSPNPQPRQSQNPGENGDTAFCSGVI